MKIAVFSDTFMPQVNGVSQTLNRFKNYLEQRGMQNIFIVPGDTKKTNPSSMILRYPGIKFPLYSDLKIPLPYYLDVKKHLKAFRPDIVHIATEFTIGLTGMIFARSHNIPLVSSYHTNYPQYLDYYKLSVLNRTAWNYLRWFHNSSGATFCPSLDTICELKMKGFQNLQLLSHGIDADLFSPQKFDQQIRNQYAPHDEVLLLYVGRLAPEKNLPLLIEAVNELNRQDYSFKLIMVGDGPEKKNLQEMSPDNVIFTGFLSGTKLYEIYASCDIFVFPSSSETFGNVVLEAMSSGLPVISVYEGGVKDTLTNRYNGLVFKTDDAQDLAEKAAHLLENRTERKKLAENARNYALSKSWEAIFDHYIDDLYDSIENYKREDFFRKRTA